MLKDTLHQLARKYRQTPPMRIKNVDRNYILDLIAQHGLTEGAEIGVASGGFSELMFEKIPNLKLLCVDTWAVGDDLQSNVVGQERADQRYLTAQERLKDKDATLVRAKSMDAVRDVPDNSLDFIYIDACHDFDYAMEDLIAWGRKVKPGGLISGDDYYRFTEAGVVQAVDAYLYNHRIQDAFITGEKDPSFFFCKPDKYPF